MATKDWKKIKGYRNVWKKKDTILQIFQISHGDIIKKWFVNVSKEKYAHNLKKHIVNEEFYSRIEATNYAKKYMRRY